ncbi:DegT/DnrJ/EryC1/StrS family aminotransferase [bacterium]|nr:DegT/DnrJ/EryC1/StrS family aminotransferase [bacterium]
MLTLAPRAPAHPARTWIAARWTAVFGKPDDVGARAGRIATLLGRRHAFFFSSDAAALFFLLRASERPAGAAVFSALCVPNMIAAARVAGFAPRLADVEEGGLCPGALNVAAEMPGASALIVDHPHGRLWDPEAIALARDAGLVVIEDVRDALGAMHQGRAAGSFGDALVFDLERAGARGAIAALDDDAWAGRLAAMMRDVRPAARMRDILDVGLGMLRDLSRFAAIDAAYRLTLARAVPARAGVLPPPPHFPGWPLPPIAFYRQSPGPGAALLAERFIEREAGLALRRRVAGVQLSRMLEGAPGIAIPPVAPGEEPAYSGFPIVADGAAALASRLVRRGVGVAPLSRALGSKLAFLGMTPAAPHAESLAARAIVLPLHAGVPPHRAERLARLVRHEAGGIMEARNRGAKKPLTLPERGT